MDKEQLDSTTADLINVLRGEMAGFFMDRPHAIEDSETIMVSGLVSLLADTLAISLCCRTDFMPEHKEIEEFVEKFQTILGDHTRALTANWVKENDKVAMSGNPTEN